MARGSRNPTVEVLIRDEVTAALERERARIRAAAGNNELFSGLQAGFAGLESSIQSLARTVGRDFKILLGLTGAGGFLGGGLVAGITKAGEAVSGLARAAEQNRYLADQIGLTTAQLTNLTARGQALGMSSEQSKAGILSLTKAMRELQLQGQDAPVYKALVEAGGASGQRVGDQLIAAVRGPGGYEAGIRQFSKLMGGMNADAQRKLSEIFNLGSLAFRDLYTVKDLPNILDLAGPQARRISVAMASLNISFDNLKTSLSGALMPAFEGLATTLDRFLQGSGAKFVQQFADWVSTLNIPWDKITKNLVGAVEALDNIFAWGKQTVADLEPHVGKVDAWGPILKKFVSAVLPGFVNHLVSLGNALIFVGKQKDVVAKIAAAISGGSDTAKPQQPLLPMPPQAKQRMGSADDDQLPMAAQPVSFMSGGSGFVIPGYATEQDDANELSAQVQAAQQQVLRLANYVASQALTTDPSGAGGLAGLAGQIRTGRIGGGGTTFRPGIRGGGGGGGGGGRRGGGGGGGPDDTPTTALGTTAGVTPEGMALLDTIATREAEPAFDKQGNRAGWNTMVGGARFDPNTDEHPHRAYPGMRGFVGGAGRSYASGRYQETTATYYENVARSKRLHPGMKVTGWSPEAQNIRNWDKAQDIYARNYRKLGIPGLTGNMQKDLEANKNNPDVLGRMSRTLSGEWTSAPGGHENAKQTGGKESYYASTYQKMLERTSRDPALAGNTGPAVPAAAGQPSPIVWSNEPEIKQLEKDEWEREHFEPGGFTPIPGRGAGRINLNVNVSGRHARVSSDSSGAMNAANVSRDKSDPSGGLEGFSPA